MVNTEIGGEIMSKLLNETTCISQRIFSFRTGCKPLMVNPFKAKAFVKVLGKGFAH